LLGRVEPTFAAALYGFIKGGSIQKAVHRLKYEQRPDIAESFGRQYGELLQASPHYCPPDMLIPIPLHYAKKEIRGYNQSTRVARGIAEVIKVPIVEDCLLKTKDLVSQTRKGREDRFLNVLNSFELRKKDKLRGQHVMIVDDVVTTGATFEAAATLLLNHLPELKIQLAAIALAHD
jgi:ComF family protein